MSDPDRQIRLAREKGQDDYWTGQKNPYISASCRQAWKKGWLQAKAGNLEVVPAAIKPNPKTVGYYVRLSPEDKALLLKMGGAKWLRQCIELARKEMK